MAVLKNIAKLSDKDTKTREAQFEAEMLALIANGEPSKSSAAAPAPLAPILPVPIITPTHDGVQISVTANGQTAHYDNLQEVPGEIRQQVMSAWIASPSAALPPVLNAPTSRNDVSPSPAKRRPKTIKMAMFLNLLIPGTGQIYLGQRLAGAAYALAFLASFAAVFAIFVHGYFNYFNLSTSGDILDSGNLEKVANAFPAGLIGALSAIGIVIYLASTIHLAMSRSRRDG